MQPKSRVFVLRVTTIAICTMAWQGSAPAQSSSSRLARAVRLYKNKQYNDAIPVLLADVKGKPDPQSAQQHMLLGECYYRTGKFGEARPHLEKAARHLPDGTNKAIAQQRLVAVAFRLNDYRGANDRIDAFIAGHPADQRVGKMLAYKMLILAKRGKSAQSQMEQLHGRIHKQVKKYGQTTGMEADRILCDFYRSHGEHEKARDVYARIVHNFREVIAERKRNKQRIPAAFEKSHDHAALQLGVIYMNLRQPSEAIKWLENVRYDQGMKQQARLMLSKMSYEQGQFDKAISYLTSEGFLDTVPAGRLKSDMFLLLGLAESSKPVPDGGKVERHLRKVGPESKGYRQAQATIGDLYYKKGLFSEAEAAYQNVLDAPSYEAQALSALGNIYVAQGRQASGESRQKVLFRKSSDMFNRLFAKYPLSPLIKPGRAQIDFLKSQGIDVSFALGEEEKLKTWEKTARDKKGTVAGARALLSLLRTHSKSVIDEKTRQVVKAPNYVASASACDSLLDEKTYTGDGFTVDSWHALRAEAAYQRAECEIASVSQAKSAASGGVVPKYLPGATAGQAIELFKRAKSLVDPKQLDLVKNIDIGLLEAMFKSSDKGLLAAAETKFVELEADYGNDARFQQLAIELADWYKQQGRLVEAAEQYAGVADRGQDLDDDARMRLLYAAGGLYSKSAYQAQQDSRAKTYAIYVYPQEVIQLGGVLKTHRPLQETIQLELPKEGRGVRALDALVAVSKAANVPFVWTPEKNPEGVARYLKQRRLDLTNGPHFARELLEQILDLKRHRLEFDIGLTGGTPTLPPISEQDQLESGVKRRLIEIYDVSRADHRFAPLVRPYGAFDKVHGGGFDVTLFRILKRVEELSETRIVWAPGIDKDEMLAAEYKRFPGVDPRSDVPCAQTLRSVLEPLELRYRIIERRVADELYEAAFAQFNKIRQINPKSQYGEKSLFNLAINFYQQQDYQKMRIVLREYLKVFDNPDYRHYRQACFWVGWALEQEKNYRDAVEYYRRAAEERIIVYQPNEGETPPSKDELKGLLSYDLTFALMEPVKGQFSGASLSDVVDFIHLNTQVDLRLGPTAQTIEAVVERKRFQKVPAWEVLHDVLSDLGLSFRVENVDKEIAQKAYYRLASTYEKDNLMQQALENCRTLLSRYPQTSRRSDTYRLMIDIHKGLKDYGNVLSTLEQYKASAGDELEKYKLDFEIGRIYFDMAAYAKAIESFRTALAAAKSASDRIAIRQGYAIALYRDGKLDDALFQFETLAKEETVPLRTFVADQMVFLLKYELGKVLEREYPEEFLRYIQKYERLSQEDRNKLSRSQFAKATWIYYVLGLIDLKKNRRDAALNKLNAVSTSPDDFLAADAAYRVGLVHMQRREFKEAREALEHLLFAMSSAESSVRATYALGICLEKLGKPKDALSRYKQLIERYPQSPYVAKIQQNPLYQKPENREQPKP